MTFPEESSISIVIFGASSASVFLPSEEVDGVASVFADAPSAPPPEACGFAWSGLLREALNQ